MRAVLIAALLTGCAVVAPFDAADPRFEACGGTVDTVDATVAFTARDYLDHFPLMGKAPELDTDEPAFAVVFAEGHGFPRATTGQLRPRDDAAPPQGPSHRTVCIHVGQPPTPTCTSTSTSTSTSGCCSLRASTSG